MAIQYEFDTSSSLVQVIWDRLRTLIGAKVFRIKKKEDLEKVAKRYKTLSGYEKSGLMRKSNIFSIIKEKKMETYVKGYTDNKGVIHKGYYKQANIRWTKKELVKLSAYKTKGRTPNQISYYLGRKPEAVKQKLYKLKRAR